MLAVGIKHHGILETQTQRPLETLPESITFSLVPFIRNQVIRICLEGFIQTLIVCRTVIYGNYLESCALYRLYDFGYGLGVIVKRNKEAYRELVFRQRYGESSSDGLFHSGLYCERSLSTDGFLLFRY